MLSNIDKLFIETTNIAEGRYIRLDEESKAKMQDKIVTSVYKSIKKKALSLDFTVIDKSRGVFSNLDNYDDIVNAIKFLRKLLIKQGYTNKDIEEAVSTLELAVDMLNKHQKYFVKGYESNSSMLKFMYEGTCIALIQLTSYLVSDCLSYVDTGSMVEIKANQSKNIKKLNIYKSLKNITDCHKNNKMEKYLKDCISINEGAISVTVNVLSWLGYAFLMIISLRAFIYAYFMTRVKISEYLAQLANFVELNAANVTDEKVKQKQKKWVDKLRTLSNKIKVDLEVSSARAEEEINEENEEINNSVPNDDLGLA